MKDFKWGCAHCMPENDSSALDCYVYFKTIKKLINESHFSASLRECPKCRQKLICFFCEEVDWAGGEDPSYFTWAPLNKDEFKELKNHKKELLEADLESLALDRIAWSVYYPKTGPKEASKRLGLYIYPHD